MNRVNGGHGIMRVEHVSPGIHYRLVLDNGEEIIAGIDGLTREFQDACELRFHSHTCSEVWEILDRLRLSHGGRYRHVRVGGMLMWFVGYDGFFRAFDARRFLLRHSPVCDGIVMYIRLRHPAWRVLLSVFGRYLVFPYLEMDKRISSPGLYVTDGPTFERIGDHETIDGKKFMKSLVRIRRAGISQSVIMPEWYVDETALGDYLEKVLREEASR